MSKSKVRFPSPEQAVPPPPEGAPEPPEYISLEVGPTPAPEQEAQNKLDVLVAANQGNDPADEYFNFESKRFRIESIYKRLKEIEKSFEELGERLPKIEVAMPEMSEEALADFQKAAAKIPGLERERTELLARLRGLKTLEAENKREALERLNNFARAIKKLKEELEPEEIIKKIREEFTDYEKFEKRYKSPTTKNEEKERIKQQMKKLVDKIKGGLEDELKQHEKNLEKIRMVLESLDLHEIIDKSRGYI